MRAFVSRHPRVALFLTLAIAMEVALYLMSRGVQVTAPQYAALAVATALAASLSVWITTWE